MNHILRLIISVVIKGLGRIRCKKNTGPQLNILNIIYIKFKMRFFYRFILDFAVEKNAIVVSRDNYRDLYQVRENIESFPTKRG